MNPSDFAPTSTSTPSVSTRTTVPRTICRSSSAFMRETSMSSACSESTLSSAMDRPPFPSMARAGVCPAGREPLVRRATRLPPPLQTPGRRAGLPKQPAEVVGDPAGTSRPVDRRMHGRPAGQDRAVRLADGLIAVLEAGGAEGGEVGPDDQDVVVPGGEEVPAAGLDHHQEPPGGLDLGIGPAASPDEFGPPGLEPDQVGGMVGHPHLIGFRVADPALEI